MNNVVISLIRTYVPIAVGAVIAWLAAKGWHIDPVSSAGLITFLTGLFSAGYYTVVRVLETQFPWLGFLLGHTAKPTYVK